MSKRNGGLLPGKSNTIFGFKTQNNVIQVPDLKMYVVDSPATALLGNQPKTLIINIPKGSNKRLERKDRKKNYPKVFD